MNDTIYVGLDVHKATVAVAVAESARFGRLAAAGRARVVVTTAIAREMVGFLSAIARQVQLAPAV